ncbi:MAG: hypothetical protein HGJ94_05170 [Desulfosarcina sp.]|nr:hypothetical protein [Desulfosarcina sp.]MBC2743623.1 hypothetical protein [Desulfosarcina sp.]MBC2766532.1 hypothetical protein [Desulfosarcina sp.]
MKDSRFLSADIDPAKDTNVKKLKEQALQLIHQELTEDQKLHDDAAVAILNDYDGMGAEAFLKQLRTYSLILNALKNKAGFQEMATLLANLLRTGLYKVDGEAMDAVTVRRDAIQVDIGGKSTMIGTVNGEFLTILSLGKESRETERQLMVIDKLVKRRSEENLEAVSRAFKIPIHDTEKITLLIQKLFDGQGNFIRKTFDPMLDELARHGNRAFELLWCYFKALKGRANRVSFLNALQHLISRIKRPKHALRFLLADFCRHPDKVDPSDRNAIMLANILLRTYNKELDVDIEMTPEEVLNVRNGLDRNVVHYAQFRIDSVEYRFSTKVRTIHEKMVALLNSTTPGKQKPSIRHLLFLEREIFIYLSLLSGKTAHLILISALTEYGDPKAGIYRNLRAATYLPVFLQHLKIIVRGVGRVGTPDDVGLLRQISEYGFQLSELNGTPENQRSVVRTMEWIENVIRNITTSNWHSV